MAWKRNGIATADTILKAVTEQRAVFCHRQWAHLSPLSGALALPPFVLRERLGFQSEENYEPPPWSDAISYQTNYDFQMNQTMAQGSVNHCPNPLRLDCCVGNLKPDFLHLDMGMG